LARGKSIDFAVTEQARLGKKSGARNAPGNSLPFLLCFRFAGKGIVQSLHGDNACGQVEFGRIIRSICVATFFPSSHQPSLPKQHPPWQVCGIELETEGTARACFS